MILRHCTALLLIGLVSISSMWGNGINPCSMSNETPDTGTRRPVRRSGMCASCSTPDIGSIRCSICGIYGCSCLTDPQHQHTPSGNEAPSMVCGCLNIISVLDYQLPGHRNFPVVVGKPVALVVYSVYLASMLDTFYPTINLPPLPPYHPPQYLLSV